MYFAYEEIIDAVNVLINSNLLRVGEKDMKIVYFIFGV
jgi:hypothetical protein